MNKELAELTVKKSADYKGKVVKVLEDAGFVIVLTTETITDKYYIVAESEDKKPVSVPHKKSSKLGDRYKTKDDSEIKVGDEVYLLDENYPRVVTCITKINDKNPVAVQLTQSGRWVEDNVIDLHKTGRHFDQIEDVLKVLNGSQERED